MLRLVSDLHVSYRARVVRCDEGGLLHWIINQRALKVG